MVLSKLNKLCLLIKPAQSGKTGKIKELIQKKTSEIENNYGAALAAALNDELDDLKAQLILAQLEENSVFSGASRVNFLFGSNNCALNRQTSSRLNGNNNHTFVYDSKIIKKGHDEADFQQNIIKIVRDDDSAIVNVVCCTNTSYSHKAMAIIGWIEIALPESVKIGIYLDEADKTMNVWLKWVKKWDANTRVSTITAVTATPEPIFKRLQGNLRVIPFNEHEIVPEIDGSSIYHCFDDSKRIIVNKLDSDKKELSSFDIMKKVFEEYGNIDRGNKLGNHNIILLPGVNSFIPAKSSCKSHEEIANFVQSPELNHPAAVFIINGQNKELRIPGQQTISLWSDIMGNSGKEMKEVISDAYIKYDLQKYPVVVTGLFCVGRGISLQSEEFIFQYGIIPKLKNKAEQYQLVGRMFGNLKHFPKYQNMTNPCTIFCSKSVEKTIIKEESVAYQLPQQAAGGKMYFNHNDCQRAAFASDDYEHIIDKSTGRFYEFDTWVEAMKFKKLMKAGNQKKEIPEYDANGFQISGISKRCVLQYDEVQDLLNKKPSSNLSLPVTAKINSRYSRLYICYKDLNDLSSKKYVLRMVEKVR